MLFHGCLFHGLVVLSWPFSYTETAPRMKLSQLDPAS